MKIKIKTHLGIEIPRVFVLVRALCAIVGPLCSASICSDRRPDRITAKRTKLQI